MLHGSLNLLGEDGVRSTERIRDCLKGTRIVVRRSNKQTCNVISADSESDTMVQSHVDDAQMSLQVNQ